jgi:hypothetical protein
VKTLTNYANFPESSWYSQARFLLVYAIWKTIDVGNFSADFFMNFPAVLQNLPITAALGKCFVVALVALGKISRNRKLFHRSS